MRPQEQRSYIVRKSIVLTGREEKALAAIKDKQLAASYERFSYTLSLRTGNV